MRGLEYMFTSRSNVFALRTRHEPFRGIVFLRFLLSRRIGLGHLRFGPSHVSALPGGSRE
jgi:hypothetical protein